METLIPVISNVGFPIAITLYLLIRLEKIITKNTEVLSELCLKIKMSGFKASKVVKN